MPLPAMTAERLADCPLFAGISQAGITSLLPCLEPNPRSFRKGEILGQAGSPQDVIGIVLDGQVQVQQENFAGERLIVGLFGSGELFGEVAAYAGRGIWPNTVVAASDGQVLFLPYERLSQSCCQACDYHQKLIRNMLGIVAGKAMLMNSRLSYLKLRGMREKLAAFLYDRYRQTSSKTFLINMNREALADYLNVSRPSMSRELGRMKDEGIIDFYRSSFTIRNLEALRSIRNSRH